MLVAGGWETVVALRSRCAVVPVLVCWWMEVGCKLCECIDEAAQVPRLLGSWQVVHSV